MLQSLSNVFIALNKYKLTSGKQNRTAGFWNVYFLGISVVFAGLLISWTDGFERSFWEYLTSTVIVGLAYIALMLCVAEMTSILPFGGGAYGFARVTVGPYMGYLIGCYESFGNIMYVAVAVVPMGECITFIFDTPPHYEPLYWLIIYCMSLCILITGGRHFFTLTTGLGIITLLLIIIYVFGTIPYMNFETNVTRSEVTDDTTVGIFKDGFIGFLYILPISSWFFVGIDTMPLICSDAIKAQTSVPRAIVACMLTIFVFSIVILFATTAQAPGMHELYNAENGLPLNTGYARLFNTNYRAATLCSMPGLFISNYAFMYAYGKQLHAMSRSNLLPPFLSRTYGDIETPYMALITGGLIGYVIMLIVWFNTPNLLHSLNYIYNACQIGSFLVYLTIFVSFIIFRVRYPNLERNYVNKLGMTSAVFGIIVFVLAAIGLCFLQTDNFQAVIMFVLFVVICSMYYHMHAKEKQCFSPEEQSILFIVYVMKANIRRRLFNRFHKQEVQHDDEHSSPSHHSNSLTPGRRAVSQRSFENDNSIEVSPSRDSPDSLQELGLDSPLQSTTDARGNIQLQYEVKLKPTAKKNNKDRDHSRITAESDNNRNQGSQHMAANSNSNSNSIRSQRQGGSGKNKTRVVPREGEVTTFEQHILAMPMSRRSFEAWENTQTETNTSTKLEIGNSAKTQRNNSSHFDAVYSSSSNQMLTMGTKANTPSSNLNSPGPLTAVSGGILKSQSNSKRKVSYDTHVTVVTEVVVTRDTDLMSSEDETVTDRTKTIRKSITKELMSGSLEMFESYELIQSQPQEIICTSLEVDNDNSCSSVGSIPKRGRSYDFTSVPTGREILE